MGHACHACLNNCFYLVTFLIVAKIYYLQGQGLWKKWFKPWETWFVILEAHDFISYMVDKLLSTVIFMHAVSEIASKWIPFLWLLLCSEGTSDSSCGIGWLQTGFKRLALGTAERKAAWAAPEYLSFRQWFICGLMSIYFRQNGSCAGQWTWSQFSPPTELQDPTHVLGFGADAFTCSGPLPAPRQELFGSWPHFIFNSQFHACMWCALMDWVDRLNLFTFPSLPVPPTSPSTIAIFPFHLHVLFSLFFC